MCGEDAIAAAARRATPVVLDVVGCRIRARPFVVLVRDCRPGCLIGSGIRRSTVERGQSE
jgi:hypothetical protein